MENLITTIYLIRHAHVDYFNYKGDAKYIDLSPNGWQHSVQLANGWVSPVEKIFTSPLNRCVETVVPLSLRLGIPYEVHDSLQELDYQGDANSFHEIIKTNQNFKYPKGESLEEASSRFDGGLLNLIEACENKAIIISSHGTVMSEFLTKTFKLDKNFFYQMTYPDVYVVEYNSKMRAYSLKEKMELKFYEKYN